MKKLQIAIMSLRDSGGTTTNRMRAERLRNSPPPNPASAYHRVISVSEPEEAAPTPATDTTQSARKSAPRRRSRNEVTSLTSSVLCSSICPMALK